MLNSHEKKNEKTDKQRKNDNGHECLHESRAIRYRHKKNLNTSFEFWKAKKKEMHKWFPFEIKCVVWFLLIVKNNVHFIGLYFFICFECTFFLMF